MQFSSAIISAITVALASAAAIEKRSSVFDVSDFSAGCIPHSSQCLYSFTVIQPGTMETTGVKCTALVAANTDGTLPDIPQWGGSCIESSRRFWVTREDAGLNFFVSQQVTPASNQTASHLLPNSELVMTANTISSTQSYTGPTSFGLDYSTSA
ncbi:putative 22kda glycoprotein [Botrytis fragariae]|uniref:Putative 22kda glycoprotein n=1 Tax=Botrytis fragariae TaxID=1964551 RepID=A0A8H6AWK6_9HELO|nr:putative 22kda glycoprotein [Botrytis fragariae]KAF5874912.1 putative 22kda glycoprotein [Botrytis fragariae]